MKLQIPLADFRTIDHEVPYRIPVPSLPFSSHTEFIRGFGSTRRARMIGLTGWAGEDVYVEAGGAVKLESCYEKTMPVSTKCGVRHFLTDGSVVNRFEIGFDISLNDYSDPLKAILSHLQQPVTIPTRTENGIPLWTAGEPLSQYYEWASTSISDQSISRCSIKAGDPVALAQFENESQHARKLTSVTRLVNHQPEVRHCWLNLSKSRRISLWIINVQDDDWAQGFYQGCHQHDKRVRLRKHLMRLHAERQSLKLVLRAIARKEICIRRGTVESDNLQLYLKRAYNLFKRKKSFYGFKVDGPFRDALDFEDLVSAEERHSLIEALSGIRRQVKVQLDKTLEEDSKIASVTFVGCDLKSGAVVVTEKKNSIRIGNNSPIHGNFTVADNISNSFNQVANSDINPNLEKLLADLVREVSQLCKSLSDVEARRVSRDLESFVAEATSEEPRKKWYSLSAEGIVNASKSVAPLFEPISHLIDSIVSALETT